MNIVAKNKNVNFVANFVIFNAHIANQKHNLYDDGPTTGAQTQNNNNQYKS